VYASDHLQSQLNELFVFSVIPAIIAWLTLLLPTHYSLMITAISFGIVLVADRSALEQDILPYWYFHLRRKLTTVVVITILVVAIRLV
jgi:Protein of unknown function (DUF3429)